MLMLGLKCNKSIFYFFEQQNYAMAVLLLDVVAMIVFLSFCIAHKVLYELVFGPNIALALRVSQSVLIQKRQSLEVISLWLSQQPALKWI